MSETETIPDSEKLARLRQAHARLLETHRRQGDVLDKVRAFVQDLTAGMEAEGVFCIDDVLADVGEWSPDVAGQLAGYLHVRDGLVEILKGAQ